MRFIDLFCGIGGIRLGFTKAGHECVFSSDIDKFARVTYEANFGELPYGDITEINLCDIPQFDILTAGFPCQPFSSAGQRKGFEDTRGTLFFEILRIAECHKPSFIFLENVKGLVSHDKGNTLKVIVQSLEDLGYRVQYNLYNARDFGTVQRRIRIFIIASLDDNYILPSLDDSYVLPNKESVIDNLTLNNFLEANVDSKYTLSDKRWNTLQDKKERREAMKSGFHYSLYRKEDKVIGTLSATGKDNLLLYQEWANPRRFTPREMARLQGFPDDFVIPVSDSQAYRQFGNTVHVPTVEFLAKSLT